MTADTTTFILLRHGETTANREHLLQGWYNAHGLDENGRAQAAFAAEYLKGVHFDAAYSSDLARAAETAETVLKFHPEVPLIRTEELREWHCGLYDGVSQVLLAREHPEVLQAFATEAGDPQMPNGESRLAFQRRIEAFFTRTARETPGKTVFVCTHGGALLRIFRMAAGVVNDLNRPPLPANAAVGVIKYLHGRGGWLLDQWNIHHYIPDGTTVDTLVV